MDGDHFSGNLHSHSPSNIPDVDELRGANWRGKDCDDDDINIRPGRFSPLQNLPGVDYNCNGISGIDSASGIAYKDLYCSKVGQMGVAILGGSACSHFEIDPYWYQNPRLNDSYINKDYCGQN